MNIELAERNHFGMLLSDWHTQRRPGWRGSPPSATQNLERFVSGEICHILTSASASSHGLFFFFPFFDGEGKKNNQIIPIALVQRRSQHLPKTIYSQFMTAFLFFYTSRFIFGYCYTRRPLGLRQTRSYCSFLQFFRLLFLYDSFSLMYLVARLCLPAEMSSECGSLYSAWNQIFFFFFIPAPPSFDFHLSRLFRFGRTAVCTLRSTSSKR